jgi:hypothetical protein
MTMFDWMPGWKYKGLPIDWLMLIGLCFGISAVYNYFPCSVAGIPVVGWIFELGRQFAGQASC